MGQFINVYKGFTIRISEYGYFEVYHTKTNLLLMKRRSTKKINFKLLNKELIKNTEKYINKNYNKLKKILLKKLF